MTNEAIPIKGTLDAFFETGTEGVYWAFNDKRKKGYDALHLLGDGDYLKVYDSQGKVYWEGEIVKDLEKNKWIGEDFPPRFEDLKGLVNSDYYKGRQVTERAVVHWLQKDVEPNYWEEMFFSEMDAELIKGENGK